MLPAGGNNSFLRSELAGRGPMPLNAVNPFVSSNQFLAREMKQSATLRGFLKYNGTPDLLEVRRDFFKPFRVYFFYLPEDEAYLLEERGDDWIIRGPEEIPKKMLPDLKQYVSAGRQAPIVIEEQGQEVTAADYDSLRDSSAENPPRANLKADTLFEDSEAASGQQAPEAELEQTASGDVLHTVHYPGETLRMISRWYTGSVSTLERIARINGIKNPDILYMGQQIRLPRYLLKTRRPLPQSEVERYLDANLPH